MFASITSNSATYELTKGAEPSNIIAYDASYPHDCICSYPMGHCNHSSVNKRLKTGEKHVCSILAPITFNSIVLGAMGDCGEPRGASDRPLGAVNSVQISHDITHAALLAHDCR
jgi:hypothetical protein